MNREIRRELDAEKLAGIVYWRAGIRELETDEPSGYLNLILNARIPLLKLR